MAENILHKAKSIAYFGKNFLFILKTEVRNTFEALRQFSINFHLHSNFMYKIICTFLYLFVCYYYSTKLIGRFTHSNLHNDRIFGKRFIASKKCNQS